MLNTYSNLVQRIMTAFIAIPIIIMALYWNAWSYFVLFLSIAMLTMLEFYKLVSLHGTAPLRFWGILSGLSLYTLLFMYCQVHIIAKYFYILPSLIACAYFIKLYQKKTAAPFTDIAYTLLGIFYIGGPFSMLHLIAFAKGFYSYEIVLGIFLILWANDTGAYMIGNMVGKHRLFKRISPQKSWEGSIGGAIIALMVGHIIADYFKILALWDWMAISGIIIVAGTYGDLIESLFKRSIHIKNSSEAIPGHGGFLDRFDSFLMAIPFILAFIKLCL